MKLKGQLSYAVGKFPALRYFHSVLNKLNRFQGIIKSLRKLVEEATAAYTAVKYLKHSNTLGTKLKVHFSMQL